MTAQAGSITPTSRTRRDATCAASFAPNDARCPTRIRAPGGSRHRRAHPQPARVPPRAAHRAVHGVRRRAVARPARRRCAQTPAQAPLRSRAARHDDDVRRARAGQPRWRRTSSASWNRSSARKIDARQLDLVLTPLVGFDDRGVRRRRRPRLLRSLLPLPAPSQRTGAARSCWVWRTSYNACRRSCRAAGTCRSGA